MPTAAAPARAALRVSHILAPIDFSDACNRAVERAAELARHFSAALTLLHAAPIAPVAYAIPEALAYAPADAEAARQVADRAARLDRLLRGPGAPAAERVVVEGDPGQEIGRYAAGHHCDLIVMPTHGYGAFQRLLLGSVTADVLHSAPCPVWTGHHPESVSPGALGPVLCAVDLERRSLDVLVWAAGFARSYGLPLEVVYALPLSTVRCGGMYFDPEWHNDVAREVRQQIDGLLREAGAEGRVSIELGDVPNALLEHARQISAGLLAIGRGPHAYSIVRESSGAVVVV